VNKAEFTDLIINPAKLGNEHIDTLKKIVADYPYFSTAQILLAKALLNTHHYEYEKQLKTTALSVANREVLNYYLNNISEDSDDSEEENSMMHVSDEIKAEEVSPTEIDPEKLEQEALLIEAQNILSNNEIPLLEIYIETENLPENNTELVTENFESESNHFDYTAPVLENIVPEIPAIETVNIEETVENDIGINAEIDLNLAETFLPDFDETSLFADDQHIETITQSVLPNSTSISTPEMEAENTENMEEPAPIIEDITIEEGFATDNMELVLTNSEITIESNPISLENILAIELENINTPMATTVNTNFETIEELVLATEKANAEATIEASNLNFFEWLKVNKKESVVEIAEIAQPQEITYYEDADFVAKIKQIIKLKAENDLNKNIISGIETAHDHAIPIEQENNISDSIVETQNNYSAEVASILPDFEALKAIEVEEEKSYIIYDKKEGLIPNYETPVFDPLFNSHFETKPTIADSDESEIEVDFNNYTIDNNLFENSFSSVYIPLPAKEIESLPTNETINVKSDTSKNEIDNILDKFMRENPSISRPKTEFFNPATVAKNSAEEKDEIVSETLARIYLKQGLIKKSILTYEKLCLIYPHKNAYFAALINKIKTEHNIN
jgi:hypothetical protein